MHGSSPATTISVLNTTEGASVWLEERMGELGSRASTSELDLYKFKRSADVLDAAQTQLAEYFSGQRRAFELPLDPPATTDFRAAVHARLAEIGYGETVTYRDVARLLGRPGATRAVGSACGANPLLIVRPCHRVLRSDGGLGGYAGGLEAKRFLLTLEEH